MIIKNLSFSFDKADSHCFFKDVNLACDKPGLYFIQGENGIGKSTLFHMLQGNIPKNALLEGTIIANGTAYTIEHNSIPAACIQQIHMVQQQYELMIADQFTFVENLQFANMPRYPLLRSLPNATLFAVAENYEVQPVDESGKSYGGISRDTTAFKPSSASFAMIKQLNIDMTKPAYLLSGGQRQLLAIIMALQKSTSILLLDEPTATLDTQNAHMIMRCLEQLATDLGIIIIIICHDTRLVEQYAKARFWVRKLEHETRVIEHCA